MYWQRPTSHEDQLKVWTTIPFAYDSDTGTRAECSAANNGKWLILLLPFAAYSKKIRVNTTSDLDPHAIIDVYYDDAWHTMKTCASALDKGNYDTFDYSSGGDKFVDKLRIQNCKNDRWLGINDIQFYIDDPFTVVMRRLWAMLEDSQALTDLVPSNNRIKMFDGSAKPEKDKLAQADTPQLLIEPIGGELQTPFSSSSGRVQQRFAISIMSGDLRVQQMFSTKWALCKALSHINDYLDLDFVRRIILSDFVDAPNDVLIPGLQSTVEILVDMFFDLTLLRG